MYRELLRSALRSRLRGMGRSEFTWGAMTGETYANKIRVEIAVKQIMCGMKIKVGASVMNKECLEWYREWAETH